MQTEGGHFLERYTKPVGERERRRRYMCQYSHIEIPKENKTSRSLDRIRMKIFIGVSNELLTSSSGTDVQYDLFSFSARETIPLLPLKKRKKEIELCLEYCLCFSSEIA